MEIHQDTFFYVEFLLLQLILVLFAFSWRKRVVIQYTEQHNVQNNQSKKCQM